jgi:hypothetical protein
LARAAESYRRVGRQDDQAQIGRTLAQQAPDGIKAGLAKIDHHAATSPNFAVPDSRRRDEADSFHPVDVQGKCD